MGKVREFQALGGWFKKKKEEKCKGLRTSVPLLNKHYAPQDLDWKKAIRNEAVNVTLNPF